MAVLPNVSEQAGEEVPVVVHGRVLHDVVEVCHGVVVGQHAVHDPATAEHLQVPPRVHQRPDQRHEPRHQVAPVQLPRRAPAALLERHQVREQHLGALVDHERRHVQHAVTEARVEHVPRGRLPLERHAGLLHLRRRRDHRRQSAFPAAAGARLAGARGRDRRRLLPDGQRRGAGVPDGVAAALVAVRGWVADVALVVQVQQVVYGPVAGRPDGAARRQVASEGLAEDVQERVAPGAVVLAGEGDAVQLLDDEEGYLVLQQEGVVVHVVPRPLGSPRRSELPLALPEEELEQEAAVQHQQLRELVGAQAEPLCVAPARLGLNLARGAHAGAQKAAAGGLLIVAPRQEVAEQAPLVLLRGAQAGAAVVVWADGHDLGLVQVAVPLAHGRREAEDGVGVVAQGRRRVHTPLHGLHLRVVVVEEAVLHARVVASPLALHGEPRTTPSTAGTRTPPDADLKERKDRHLIGHLTLIGCFDDEASRTRAVARAVMASKVDLIRRHRLW